MNTSAPALLLAMAATSLHAGPIHSSLRPLADGWTSTASFQNSEKLLRLGTLDTACWIVFDSADLSGASSAVLQLHVRSATGGSVALYRLLSAPAVPEELVSQGDLSLSVKPIATIPLDVSQSGTILRVDLTDSLKTSSFHGLVLKSLAGLQATFDSREGSLGPVIVVTYAPPLTVKGSWLGSIQYAAGDAVTYGGQLYQAQSAVNGGAGPGSDLTWLLMVGKGDPGPKGSTGAPGSNVADSVNSSTTITRGVIQYGNLSTTTVDTLYQTIVSRLYPSGSGTSSVPVANVDAGAAYALFLDVNGAAFSTGHNDFGQLGDFRIGANGFRDNPAPVLFANQERPQIRAISAGSQFSLFLRTDSTLWGVGLNGSGQLGDGTNTDRSTPVQARTAAGVLTGVKAIGTGRRHSFAILADGSLWATGSNDSGQLGDNSTAASTLFHQVATHVIAAAGGRTHSLIIKDDSTLWAVGGNLSGQLGDGSAEVSDSSFKLVSTTNKAIALAAGENHSIFLQTDSSAWAFGENDLGQLGDSSTAPRSAPVRILNHVAAVSAKGQSTLYLLGDGRVFATGVNDDGELGIGNLTSQNRPTLTISLPTIKSIASGWYSSFFTTTDGKVYGAGFNGYGDLGDGTTTSRSTPVLLQVNH